MPPLVLPGLVLYVLFSFMKHKEWPASAVWQIAGKIRNSEGSSAMLESFIAKRYQAENILPTYR